MYNGYPDDCSVNPLKDRFEKQPRSKVVSQLSIWQHSLEAYPVKIVLKVINVAGYSERWQDSFVGQSLQREILLFL